VKVAQLHPWKVSVAQALAIQERLRSRVRSEPLARPPRLVAAADVAYSRPTHRMYAVVVVVDRQSGAVVETVHVTRAARFPYIPGLFTFREAPPLVAAFQRLQCEPDLLLFDGQGLAHPRRFGLACHMGVLTDRPSVGCAKSRLIGEHRALGERRGAWEKLHDSGEVVGAVVRTRDGVRPVYVSVGHRVELGAAIELVLDTTAGFRLPEPIRKAHHATNVLMHAHDGRVRPVDRPTYPDLIKARH
jgi:deoxyribonuclease V